MNTLVRVYRVVVLVLLSYIIVNMSGMSGSESCDSGTGSLIIQGSTDKDPLNLFDDR